MTLDELIKELQRFRVDDAIGNLPVLVELGEAPMPIASIDFVPTETSMSIQIHGELSQ